MIDFLVVVVSLYLILNFSIAMLVLKYNFGVDGRRLDPLYTAFLSLFIGIPLMIYSKRKLKEKEKEK